VQYRLCDHLIACDAVSPGGVAQHGHPSSDLPVAKLRPIRNCDKPSSVDWRRVRPPRNSGSLKAMGLIAETVTMPRRVLREQAEARAMTSTIVTSDTTH
jgi:hypothetical protein